MKQKKPTGKVTMTSTTHRMRKPGAKPSIIMVGAARFVLVAACGVK